MKYRLSFAPEKRFTKEELLEIYGNFNGWRWDERISKEPGWWKGATIEEMLPVTSFVMREVSRLVSEHDRLHYHNTVRLGKSDEEFETWWLGYVSFEEADKEIPNPFPVSESKPKHHKPRPDYPLYISCAVSALALAGFVLNLFQQG